MLLLFRWKWACSVLYNHLNVSCRKEVVVIYKSKLLYSSQNGYSWCGKLCLCVCVLNQASWHAVIHPQAPWMRLQFQVITHWWVLISLNEGGLMMQIIIWASMAGNTQLFTEWAPGAWGNVNHRRNCMLHFKFSSKLIAQHSSVLHFTKP